MKSLQLALAIQRRTMTFEQADQYTELRTLRSPAGWYVGTLTREGSPGSRDTDYFADENDADFVLRLLEKLYPVFLEYVAKGGADNTLVDFALTFSDVLCVCGLNPRDVGYRLEP